MLVAYIWKWNMLYHILVEDAHKYFQFCDLTSHSVFPSAKGKGLRISPWDGVDHNRSLTVQAVQQLHVITITIKTCHFCWCNWMMLWSSMGSWELLSSLIKQPSLPIKNLSDITQTLKDEIMWIRLFHVTCNLIRQLPSSLFDSLLKSSDWKPDETYCLLE